MFVLYNEEMDNVDASIDKTDADTSDTRVLRELSSPISLFSLKEDGFLKVIAIQWDSKPGDPTTLNHNFFD